MERAEQEYDAMQYELAREYERGRIEAINEFCEALTEKRCECCSTFRKECSHCFIDDIAEHLKGKHYE